MSLSHSHQVAPSNEEQQFAKLSVVIRQSPEEIVTHTFRALAANKSHVLRLETPSIAEDIGHVNKHCKITQEFNRKLHIDNLASSVKIPHLELINTLLDTHGVLIDIIPKIINSIAVTQCSIAQYSHQYSQFLIDIKKTLNEGWKNVRNALVKLLDNFERNELHITTRTATDIRSLGTNLVNLKVNIVKCLKDNGQTVTSDGLSSLIKEFSNLTSALAYTAQPLANVLDRKYALSIGTRNTSVADKENVPPPYSPPEYDQVMYSK